MEKSQHISLLVNQPDTSKFLKWMKSYVSIYVHIYCDSPCLLYKMPVQHHLYLHYFSSGEMKLESKDTGESYKLIEIYPEAWRRILQEKVEVLNTFVTK